MSSPTSLTSLGTSTSSLTALGSLSSRMRRRLWAAGTTLVVVLGAVAAAVVTTLSGGPAVATPAQSAPPPPTVSVATVALSEVTAWHEFSGRLEAVDRVDVRSRVSGVVQAVHFREGALVQRGDPLLTIDPAPYAAEADRAEAQVVAAQARVAYTKNELERAQRLWDERAIAQREFDERLNAQREADANLRAAQAALQSARLNLSYTQLRAPVAGRIGRLEVTVGNLVAAGPAAPVLTTLVSVHPIYASFEADEQVVAQALRDVQGDGREGRGGRALERIPVQMWAATAGAPRGDDAPYAGRLQLVDNQVDASSGTVRVRAVFDNADGGLMPGQYARLRMGRAAPGQALLVHERAVGTDQNRKYVLVVDADNKAAYREVALGATHDGLRIVERGLQPGERVIVNGLQRVRPGAAVSPQDVAMDPKAAALQPQAGSGQAPRS